MRIILLLLLVATTVAAEDCINPVQFGADPTGAKESTLAVRRAIASIPEDKMIASAILRGAHVCFPRGAFKFCSAEPGQCVGGATTGAPCLKHADCPPQAGTARPRCTAISTVRPGVRITGAGPYATELVAWRGCNDQDLLGIAPGGDVAEVSQLRLVKIEFPRVGTGVGLVIRGQAAAVRDVYINGFGGHGLEIDGEFGVARANGARLDRVASTQNGGDGFYVHSYGGPNGVGDGSQHTFTGLKALDNYGAGLRLEASKNWVTQIEANGNAGGGVVIGADYNMVSAYFEIANQPTCVTFTAGADYNVVVDNSGCNKTSDAGTGNHVLLNGAWR